MSEPPAPLSPDGKLYWDGARWVPVKGRRRRVMGRTDSAPSLRLAVGGAPRDLLGLAERLQVPVLPALRTAHLVRLAEGAAPELPLERLPHRDIVDCDRSTAVDDLPAGAGKRASRKPEATTRGSSRHPLVSAVSCRRPAIPAVLVIGRALWRSTLRRLDLRKPLRRGSQRWEVFGRLVHNGRWHRPRPQAFPRGRHESAPLALPASRSPRRPGKAVVNRRRLAPSLPNCWRGRRTSGHPCSIAPLN